MPRHLPTVPPYRLHKPSGQAVVTLSGKDIYLGVHGTPHSHQQYEQVIAEWLANHRQRPASSTTGATPDHALLDVNGLFLAYWRFCEGYYVDAQGKIGRECVNIQHAIRPMIELFGSVLVRDVRPSTLKAVRDAMIQQDLARKTINGRVNRIRRMFRWGVENDLVDATVLHALEAVAPLRLGRGGVRESNPVTPVAEAVIDATLHHMPPMLQAMVRTQLYTGMRPGEVVIMRTADLNMAGPVWVYRPSSHKTKHFGHERVVYIGKKAQKHLEPYLKPDLNAFIFTPRQAMEQRWQARPTHRRSPSTARKTKRKIQDRYTPTSYLRAVYHACDAAFPPPPPLAKKHLDSGKKETDQARRQRLTAKQLEQLKQWQKEHRWHPNQLRHNAATHLRKQFGIEAARVVLGHRSAAVTEIYAELDQVKAEQIMSQVG